MHSCYFLAIKVFDGKNLAPFVLVNDNVSYTIIIQSPATNYPVYLLNGLLLLISKKTFKKNVSQALNIE